MVTKPIRKSLVYRLMNRMAWVGLCLIVAAIVAGECGRFSWFLDLFSHFKLQYLVILTVPLLWFGFRKEWKLATIALVATGVVAWQIFPLWNATALHSQAEPNVRLMSVNVNAGNSQYDAVIDLVRQEEPDVVVFQEVTGEWSARLKVLSDIYPHRKIAPQPDAFGMAVFSLHPFEDVTVHRVGAVPWIEAQVRIAGSPFRLLAAHTLPPIGGRYSKRRNRQLNQISRFRNLADGIGVPFIVAGDLNCSPWSPHMRDTLVSSNLVSARDGFGVLPSWPAGRTALWIPIDHVLVSPDIGVCDFRLGAANGSDHFPVITDLAIGDVR